MRGERRHRFKAAPGYVLSPVIGLAPGHGS
jgi:hypothetical protein